MKKITNHAELLAEKQRLLGKQQSLEKSITGKWGDLKSGFLPGKSREIKPAMGFLSMDDKVVEKLIKTVVASATAILIQKLTAFALRKIKMKG